MASPSSRNWLFRIQVLLISAGIVSIAMVLKVSVVPLALNLSSSYFTPLKCSLLTWLKPPFLYLVINGIIIAIAASSRFHRIRQEASPQAIPGPPERVVEVGVAAGAAGGNVHRVFKDKRVVVESGGCLEIEGGGSDADDEAEVVEMDSMEVLTASGSPAMKPPVSSSLLHRKSLSVIPGGGRALRARDCEGHETMEAVWKAVTEGRALTPTVMRHLSGCDTWEDQERQISSPESNQHPPPLPVMTSETSNERKDQRQLPRPSPVSLTKEPSLSPEELNRRVESFIRKVNAEMRLQRMVSSDQLKEMMGRGL